MFITKKAISRRTVLRGIGTTLALPLLDGMVPAFTAIGRTAAKPIMRFAAMYVPMGMVMENWTPKTTGAGFEMTPIMQPLTPFRKQLTVVSGLDNAGIGHPGAASAFLTDVRARGGANIHAGVSMDQFIAQQIGQENKLPSLELGIDLNFLAGQCENSYSCAYLNTLAWTSATTPLPTENNPRIVFERLFGDGGSPEAQAERARKKRSMLDSVLEDLNRLQRRLGPGDRVVVTDYVDAVREVERRIAKAETQTDSEVALLARPKGIPERFDEHVKLMYELQWLAFRADLTRVVTFMLGRELNFRTYPEIGVTEGHHGLSHHQDRPEQIAKYAKVGVYQAELFRGFLEKLQATPDGDGTMLDHTLLLYGAGLSNPNTHAHTDLPLLVIGGRDSRIEGNRHVMFHGQVPMTNLLLTLLDKIGVRADTLGDSNGRIPVDTLPGV